MTFRPVSLSFVKRATASSYLSHGVHPSRDTIPATDSQNSWTSFHPSESSEWDRSSSAVKWIGHGLSMPNSFQCLWLVVNTIELIGKGVLSQEKALPLYSDQRFSERKNVIIPRITSKTYYFTPCPPMFGTKYFTQAGICFCSKVFIKVEDNWTCNLASNWNLFVVRQIFVVLRKLQDHFTLVVYKLRVSSLGE